jgi:hypothetical protein
LQIAEKQNTSDTITMANVVNQGKYFLVEESQARQASEEIGVELGFTLHNVSLPSSRNARGASNLATSRFRGMFGALYLFLICADILEYIFVVLRVFSNNN